jgi:putative membrane protein insertion efficiency factor
MGVNRILIAAVRVYQWILSPALRFLVGTSGACRYSPTCSCYAIEAFQRHGAWYGLKLTTGRLLRCHPWGGAGEDPVPPLPGRRLEMIETLGLKSSGGRKL